MAAGARSWRDASVVAARPAWRSFPAGNRRSAPFRLAFCRRNEGLLDALQQRHQLFAFLRGKIAKRGLDRCFGNGPDALVDPLGFRREIDPLDAPVVALRPTFNPAIYHEPVDH